MVGFLVSALELSLVFHVCRRGEAAALQADWDKFVETKSGKDALVLGHGASADAVPCEAVNGARRRGHIDIWSNEAGLTHPCVVPTHVVLPWAKLDEMGKALGGWGKRAGLLRVRPVQTQAATPVFVAPRARIAEVGGIAKLDRIFEYDEAHVTVGEFSCTENSGVYNATAARLQNGMWRPLEVRCGSSETVLLVDILLRLGYRNVFFTGVDYTKPVLFHKGVPNAPRARGIPPKTRRRRGGGKQSDAGSSPRDKGGFPTLRKKEFGRIPLFLAQLSLYNGVDFYVASPRKTTTLAQFLPTTRLTHLGEPRPTIVAEARLPWFRQRGDGTDFAPASIATEWQRLQDKRAGRTCVVIVGSGSSVNSATARDVQSLQEKCAVFGMNLAWLHPHFMYDYYLIETNRDSETLDFRVMEDEGLLYAPLFAKTGKHATCCANTTWITSWSASRRVWPSVFKPAGSVSDFFRDVVVLRPGIDLIDHIGACTTKDLPPTLPAPGQAIVGRCSASLTQLVWIVLALGFRNLYLFGFDFSQHFFFLEEERKGIYPSRERFNALAKHFIKRRTPSKAHAQHPTRGRGTPEYVARMLKQFESDGVHSYVLEPGKGNPLVHFLPTRRLNEWGI